MKTVEEIIKRLEMKLAEAQEMHDLSEDKQERLYHLLSVHFIAQLLDEIKNQ